MQKTRIVFHCLLSKEIQLYSQNLIHKGNTCESLISSTWEVFRTLHHFPFPTLLSALQNIKEAEITFRMRCVTNQTKCVNTTEEKHKEIKEVTTVYKCLVKFY